MKNFLSLLGLMTLFIFSFIYTEQTIMVVKDMDDTMIELKQKSASYNTKPIPAKVTNDTLIPGIAGKKVDINKSYVKIKEYGRFDANLLVYKKELPEINIGNSYDKFIISGNPDKRMVSLIFLVHDQTDLSKIIDILNDKKVKATFFVDGNWLEKQVESLDNLISTGHTIGNLSYNGNYQDSSFVWIDTIITKIGKQDKSYCYSENKDKKVIDICKLYKDATITPNIVIKNNGLTILKRNLKAGSLIAMEINDQTEQELPTYINYIKSKGYKLDNLKNHLEE